MATPHENDLGKVVRIAKCLYGEYCRLAHLFPFGKDDGIINVCSDSEWVGCRDTRKSASGGVRLRTAHHKEEGQRRKQIIGDVGQACMLRSIR